MQLARRFRIPALVCALAVLVCEFISRPYAAAGIVDDGPYILVAQMLAKTGHILYNGWETPMLGAQLFLGAAFIKLFGFSFTAARMSVLLVAVLLAFVLQRTLVRAGVNERNATLGTLAFVLSPLYLMLSVTYMTDITCLFGIVLCLYGCLRALEASTDRTAIAWLCFAVAADVVCGTARQLAWLAILVMVPSALFLLRSRRRVLLAGVLANLVGVISAVACELWFRRQPYTEPEHLVLHRGEQFDVLSSFFHASLELPFLLLPIAILFLPELLRNIRRSIKILVAASVLSTLILLALYHWRHNLVFPVLDPCMGGWVTRYGTDGARSIRGKSPIFLNIGTRVVLTVASIGGLLGLIVSLSRPRQILTGTSGPQPLPWRQLGILLAPFALAYSLLLIPRAATAVLFDRYLLFLMIVALPWMLRYYQEQIRPRLPAVSLLLVALWAVYGMASVYDMFSFYRARAALAAELRAQGVPDTSVDNGWEYNFDAELQHASYINEPRITLPANAYTYVPPPAVGACKMYRYNYTPHIHPIYGISFDPNTCYGPAPFAPVHYSRWPYRTPGTLYAVRYLPPVLQHPDPASLNPLPPG